MVELGLTEHRFAPAFDACCRKGKDGKVISGPRYPVPIVGGLIQMVMDPFAFWERQRKCGWSIVPIAGQPDTIPLSVHTRPRSALDGTYCASFNICCVGIEACA